MKKYLLVLTCLFAFNGYAQPTIGWQKTLGGSDSDGGRNVLQTSDGGYIVLGNSNSTDGDISGNHGGSDAFVIKLSAAGAIEWQKSYGGTESDGLYKIVATNDGGYIMAGTTQSDDGDVSGQHGLSDCWIVKIDGSGNLQWQKCLGGTNGDGGNTIRQTADGGYIVGADTASADGDVSGNHVPANQSGSSDLWVVKLSAVGDIIWQKCLGSYSSDYLSSVIQTDDGGYIAVGKVQGNDGDVTGHHGEFDYWVVKLSSIGAIQWQKSLGGTDWDSATDVIQNTDGNYIVAGFSASENGDITNVHGGGDAWVVALDGAGELIWQNAIGGTGSDFFFSIRQTTDGGYVCAGDSTSNDQDATGNHGADTLDYWVVKLSGTGAVAWHKLLGGTDNDTAVSVFETTNGNYIASGYAASTDGDVLGNHGDNDAWIVSLTTNLSVTENNLMPIALYPNPAAHYLAVDTEQNLVGTMYTIYDQLARVVKAGAMEAENTIQLDGLANGIYVLAIAGKHIRFLKN